MARVRARPDFATTPAFRKMIEQIEHYGPKLFAAPLVVTTPEGPHTIHPQRTNNIMERFFRDLKRDCRRKTGANALGRTLRTMLADTPLVKNLQNPEYLKILLNGQPNLEALFAQIEPAAARQELRQAQQNPGKTPRALKRFIASLPTPTPSKTSSKTSNPTGFRYHSKSKWHWPRTAAIRCRSKCRSPARISRSQIRSQIIWSFLEKAGFCLALFVAGQITTAFMGGLGGQIRSKEGLPR